MGNAYGILAMALAVVVFIASDALVKFVGASLPSAQTIGVYSLFATLWLALALVVSGAWRHMRRVADRHLAVRTVLGCVGIYTYLVALFHIPIGMATAIKLSSPLMLTALAVVLLKERVDWRLWAAVIVGFAGVLLVIQPRPGNLDIWLWLVLLATAANALRDVMTRVVSTSVPALIIAFAGSAMAAIVGCAWAVVEGWRPMSGLQLVILCVGSVLLAVGYQLIVLAMRLGEVSVVGSFRYTAILWAVAIGYVVWHEVPNAVAIVGIAVIVASGLYIVGRERNRARIPSRRAQAEEVRLGLRLREDSGGVLTRQP
jgi:drug/metabolite transporter (DMT)-like permease